MPRTTIRQSVIVLNKTRMRAPAILRRIGIPRRVVYGVLSRHAVRPNEVKDLPRSGRSRTGMCQQLLQTGLIWHYGGLTAQKYTDHILRPHDEPHIDYHALADELSSSQDKRGVSSQCGDWCLPVASKGSRYQYYWEHMVVYIQTQQYNESNT